MLQKKQFFIEHYDYIRTAMLQEPRGHKGATGALVTEPVDEESKFGVIWMGADGYFDMCGHGSLCLGKWAIQHGIVPPSEPVTEFSFDTPAGMVKIRADVKDGEVNEVTMTGVPSFYVRSIELDVNGIGKVSVDIAYGGNFFGFVDAASIGVEPVPENLSRVVEVAMRIKEEANNQIKVAHPLLKEKFDIEGLKIVSADNETRRYGGILVFLNGAIDRTPCGSGTCAYLSVLRNKGVLKVNQDSYHKNLLGLQWRARIVAETMIGSYNAIIPEITGDSFMTGMTNMILDSNDPVKNGFLLEDLVRRD